MEDTKMLRLLQLEKSLYEAGCYTPTHIDCLLDDYAYELELSLWEFREWAMENA